MESLPSQSECSNKFKLSYVTFLTANFAWHTGIDAHNIRCLLSAWIVRSYYWVQDNKRYVAKLDGCMAMYQNYLETDRFLLLQQAPRAEMCSNFSPFSKQILNFCYGLDVSTAKIAKIMDRIFVFLGFKCRFRHRLA